MLCAQNNAKTSSQNARPKLVVGIVVDQMRWDYLYRFYDRYSSGGFKRLMHEGYNCENAFIPYTPTVTGAGHASTYTGTVPAIHGITGNDFYDYILNRKLYCSEDNSVQSVGTTNDNGKMSPRNMLTTTICDELKLATNFKSKVIGVSLKDRGSILPAGHSADAAYWYDSKTGSFITSTYYMNELPEWVKSFNAAGHVEKLYQQNWNTMYPLNTYTQSDGDVNPYENTPFGPDQKGFPYDFGRFIEKKNYGAIRFAPQGNTLTLDFAKAAMQYEQLGKDSITDFLAVSFSSPDYTGHAFGPNSIEVEDTYLRLDRELNDFFAYLDKEVGKGMYTIFLTADHGVAHIPGFLEKHKLPNGKVTGSAVDKELTEYLKDEFEADSLYLGSWNYQFFLNHEQIENKELEKEDIIEAVIAFLESKDGVDRALEYGDLQEAMLPKALKEQFINGYHPRRCGDVLAILKPGYIDDEYDGKGTTHGIWSPYDAHIPLLFYGFGVNKGTGLNRVNMTDIAPTISSILHIQMPSGCIGNTITDVVKH
jgi:predicted AlkP superfamily pyrophosphatase or phosphodiesterase